MPMISEATGFFASSLVLLTFAMKNMRMLRIIAIFSNVAFIAYGILDWLPPVLSLHLLLLPLNLLRLKEIQARASAKTNQPRLALGRA
jgi:CRP/FNR family transcriptional regulator, cyclic AMP receptor protein